MDDLLIARLVAAGRVLFGIACLAVPRQILRQWGKDAPPAMLWWIRAFGVRDAVLGAGALVTLNGDEPDTSWVMAGAIADTGDAIVAAVFREELGPAFTIPTFAVAGPAAALGWKAAIGLRKG
ncbi:MAG: hypothetical protein U0Q22_09920 [Acidimicrobiales bacterium]